MNAISLNAIPLNDQQQVRLNKMNEIKDYFVAEIKERELMSKSPSKHIVSFEYFDMSLIVSSVTSDSISIAHHLQLGAPVGIASPISSLAFSISAGIVEKLSKTTRNKTRKHDKIVMLAKVKLNSTESKISEALINNEISHEDFMAIISEERNYRELNESIRMMNSQGIDAEKINLIEEGKEIGISEIIKRNEINVILLFKV